MIFCPGTVDFPENSFQKAIYKVWERKPEHDLPFKKCGSENWSLIGYLQSVGAKTGARLLFTKCGSENWSSFGYLQSVRAKTGARLAIYKV